GTSNTYSGLTTISAGTFQANARNAFSPNSGISLANVASANLNLNGFDNTVLFFSGGGTTGGNIQLGANTLTMSTSANSGISYAGAISGSGNLVINMSGGGAPSLTLSGTNTAFTGNTTLTGGTLTISNADALGPSNDGNI